MEETMGETMEETAGIKLLVRVTQGNMKRLGDLHMRMPRRRAWPLVFDWVRGAWA